MQLPPAFAAALCGLLLSGCAFQRPYDLLTQGVLEDIEVGNADTLGEFVHCVQVRLEIEPNPVAVSAGFVSEPPAFRRITLIDGLELRSMGAQANFVARFLAQGARVRVLVYSNPWAGHPRYGGILRAAVDTCADGGTRRRIV